MKFILRVIKKISRLFLSVFLGKKEYAKYLGVKIGENCRIYNTEWGTEPFLIDIGDKVTITSGVKFITHDGTTWLMNDEKGRRYYYY